MHPSAKKWLVSGIKIAIAVVALWWVARRTPWNDLATLAPGRDILGVTLVDPVDVTVVPADPAAPPAPNALRVRLPEAAVKVRDADGHVRSEKLAKALSSGEQTREVDIGRDAFVKLEDDNEIKIQIGLRNLVKNARPALLIAAWAVLGVPFLVTAWRWKKLMEPQGIRLPYSKCLALTFVGQFYSTFLPGITGGDLVKIIFTSKVTGSKTKSTITVLLDRVLGLVALLVIAGASAAMQAPGNPTMARVAALIGLVLLGLIVVTALYFSRRIRRLLGIERLTESARERLAARAAARERGEEVPEEPHGGKVEKVRKRVAEIVVQFDETLHVYRKHVGVLGVAFLVSLFTQLMPPLSAYLAGSAFGMTAPLGVYFAYVPLALLAASVPFSPPQGFGVTEYILLHFFHYRGTDTASQTFALAQAIRFLPIAWNLIGAYWVVTGTYTRHEAKAEVREGAPLAR